MEERFATVSIERRDHLAGQPVPVPAGVSDETLNAANKEARRRIVEAYDTGMAVVAESLRKLLADGWRPDRESVAEFCSQVESNAASARR